MVNLTRLVYLALLVLQPVWLWLLDKPVGYENPWLAAFLGIPLLFPLAGVLAGSFRKAVIGAYLTLPHFMFAVSEAWARPTGRTLAILQLILVIAYWLIQIQRGRIRKRQG